MKAKRLTRKQLANRYYALLQALMTIRDLLPPVAPEAQPCEHCGKTLNAHIPPTNACFAGVKDEKWKPQAFHLVDL